MDEKAAVTYPIAKDEEDHWVEIKNARAGGWITMQASTKVRSKVTK